MSFPDEIPGALLQDYGVMPFGNTFTGLFIPVGTPESFGDARTRLKAVLAKPKVLLGPGVEIEFWT